jgi:hypothetical protein
VPELIRLELAPDSIPENRSGPAPHLNGRERKLYAALLALASVNIFLICGAIAFLWLVMHG